jgi:membrane-associated phospholipid phosphatase
VSYGFATVISLSRITTIAHWPSDVFLGAAIGYSVSKYEVLRPQ